MRVFCIIVSCILCVGILSAQNTSKPFGQHIVKVVEEPKELKVGDICPDIKLEKIINSNTQSGSIHDYKGKLLILDFWATWCAPCVKALPKIDSLQRVFNKSVVILPVSSQSEATVRGFLNNMKQVRNFSLPSVVEAQALRKAFRFTVVPHLVWINESSEIVAITGGEQLTAGTIKKFLSGDAVAIPVKKDVKRKIDSREKVFSLAIPPSNESNNKFDVLSKDEVLYHSVLTRYVDGAKSFQENRSANKFTAMNSTFKSLYKWPIAWCYKDSSTDYSDYFSDSRFIFEVEDSILYKLSSTRAKEIDSSLQDMAKMKQWYMQNSYCYELIVPNGTNEKEKFKRVLQDFNDYFSKVLNVKVDVEKRKVKCMVLTKVGPIDSLMSKGNVTEHADNHYYYKLKNGTLKEMLTRFKGYYFQLIPYPILDETGITGNVDLELHAKLSSIDSVNKELKKYGLQFLEAEREIKMIVVKQLK